MEQTAKTKTIKILCIVLAIAIVVAGIITGLVAFFNGNFYRFRMSAFTGEYIQSESIKRLDWVITFYFWESHEEYSYSLPLYCFAHNETGEIKLYQLARFDKKVELNTIPFDENIYQRALNYALAFEQECTVKHNKILFANDLEVKITNSKRSTVGINMPCRIATGIDKNDATYQLEFETNYISYDHPEYIMGATKKMSINLTATIAGTDNKEYNFCATTYYINKAEYLSERGLDK